MINSSFCLATSAHDNNPNPHWSTVADVVLEVVWAVSSGVPDIRLLTTCGTSKRTRLEDR